MIAPLVTNKFTDEQIKNLIKQGDAECLQWLISRFSGGLISKLKRSLRSEEDAEEVFMDAVLAVSGKIDSFDPTKSKFSSWLYRIAINKAIDQIRARRAIKKQAILTELDDDHKAFLQIKSPKPAMVSPEESDLEKILNRLTPGEKEILLMKYSAGMSHREIAEQFHILENACRARVSRAARKLEKLI